METPNAMGEPKERALYDPTLLEILECTEYLPTFSWYVCNCIKICRYRVLVSMKKELLYLHAVHFFLWSG